MPVPRLAARTPKPRLTHHPTYMTPFPFHVQARRGSTPPNVPGSILTAVTDMPLAEFYRFFSNGDALIVWRSRGEIKTAILVGPWTEDSAGTATRLD